MTNRLFIALDIPYMIRQYLVENRAKIYGSGFDSVRWEPIEKLHVTLNFLGDTDSEIVPELTDKLKIAVQGENRIVCNLTSYGFFNRRGERSILWAGLTYPEEFRNLVKSINAHLSEINLKIERRKFIPHITLLRLRGREKKESIERFVNGELDRKPFECGTVTLYESKLLPKKSVYYKIKQYILL